MTPAGLSFDDLANAVPVFLPSVTVDRGAATRLDNARTGFGIGLLAEPRN